MMDELPSGPEIVFVLVAGGLLLLAYLALERWRRAR